MKRISLALILLAIPLSFAFSDLVDMKSFNFMDSTGRPLKVAVRYDTSSKATQLYIDVGGQSFVMSLQEAYRPRIVGFFDDALGQLESERDDNLGSVVPQMYVSGNGQWNPTELTKVFFKFSHVKFNEGEIIPCIKITIDKTLIVETTRSLNTDFPGILILLREEDLPTVKSFRDCFTEEGLQAVIKK
jgi:hypothetical protein